MAFFNDLEPCGYFSVDPVHKLIAVGWLDAAHPHSRGPVRNDVFFKLCELLVSPWQPVHLLGFHNCSFCRFTSAPHPFQYSNTTVQLGVTNVFVPGDGVLFVAPSLVLHYIDAHDYSPPEVFCDAVLKCPPMRSMEYLKAIKGNGPRFVIPT